MCECGAPIGNAKHRGGHTIADGNTLWGYTSKSRLGQGGLKDARGKTVKGGTDLSQNATVDSLAGYGINGADTEQKSFSVRQLPPPYVRVIRFFTHAVLSLARECNFLGSAASSVERLLVHKLSNDEDFLLKHMKNDWSTLKHLIGCDGVDLSIIMQLVIENFQTRAQSAEYGVCTTTKQRENFELFFKSDVMYSVLSGWRDSVRAVKMSMVEGNPAVNV